MAEAYYLGIVMDCSGPVSLIFRVLGLLVAKVPTWSAWGGGREREKYRLQSVHRSYRYEAMYMMWYGVGCCIENVFTWA
jgi:hypothetical protein